MGSVPEALLRRKFLGTEPMGHETRAGRIAHPVDIAVDDPEGADQVHKAHGGLPFSVEKVKEAVEFRGETDEQVYHARQQEAKGHHAALVRPVCDDAVDETADPVHYPVRSKETSQLGLAQPKGSFHRGNRGAEILPKEIIAGVADHEDDQGTPLPVLERFLMHKGLWPHFLQTLDLQRSLLH